MLSFAPEETERLALLVPEAAQWLPHNLVEYALLFAARYQDDVLQLEQEWYLLTKVLVDCWRAGKYPAVLRLATVLALPAGRRARPTEGEYVLRLGLAASRRCQDRSWEAAFLNRLGGLMFARGKYDSGWRVWQAGLQLALSINSRPAFWQPMASFAFCVDILANPDGAQHFVTTMQTANDSEGLTVALFCRGLYARFTNNLATAFADFSACLRLLLPQYSSARWSPTWQLFSMVVQTELARAEGHYARAHMCAKTALELAELFSDLYTVASLLIDQGLFTYQQGQLTDLYEVYLQLQTLANQLEETPHIAERCRFLEQQLIVNGLLAPTQSTLIGISERKELLSRREYEVLQQVAQGFANQEIAASLVITPGTVKKHLEHIYTKLDVCNRTAAVARARQIKIIS